MKISKERAIAEWERSLLRSYNPDPGNPPQEKSKMYKDNPKNEWLTNAIKRLGGPKKTGQLINRNATYISNVMKGYYPMSAELEKLIKEELEKDR